MQLPWSLPLRLLTIQYLLCVRPYFRALQSRYSHFPLCDECRCGLSHAQTDRKVPFVVKSPLRRESVAILSYFSPVSPRSHINFRYLPSWTKAFRKWHWHMIRATTPKTTPFDFCQFCGIRRHVLFVWTFAISHL